MSSVNKTIIVGHLGGDPESKKAGNTTVTSFSVATSESFTNRKNEKRVSTTWHRVVAFGRLGDTAAQYLKKGSHVYVEGKIQNRSWEDDKGNKKYMTEIHASNIQFLGSRDDEDNNDEIPF